MRIKQLLSLAVLPLALSLSGCSASFAPGTDAPAAPGVEAGAPFSGSVSGGRQPIAYSHLYIFAADTTAYGHASDSLIQPYSSGSYPSILDSSGNYYITTNSGGDFALAAGQYACAVGQQVYLYSVGGNPGDGPNSAAGLMAVLGTCESGGTFSALHSFVFINEVSTVAAAYAVAGFAADATHISSSGTSLALTGLTNAFNNAANLYNISGSSNAGALAATPAGDGTVPQLEINTLADILASCINSTGPTSTTCSSLLTSAKSAGSTGTEPTDTVTAAINIAHNPGNAVSTLFPLASSIVPWTPVLTTQPNDFTIAIAFNDDSFTTPQDIAIDASGNAWFTNYGAGAPSVAELSPTGAMLSGTGYTNASFGAPYGIAVDLSGNAWVADSFSDVVIEIGPSGSILSGDFGYGYTSGDINQPQGIAIDPYGNAWVAQLGNVVLEFSGSGTELSAPNGFTGSNLTDAYAVAVDASGDAFFANYANKYGAVGEFSKSGTYLSTGAHGYGYAADQRYSNAIAIGRSGTVWATNLDSSSVTELSNTGTVLSGGGTGAYTSGGISIPAGIAFDGAGDAWITNGNGSLSELSGSGVGISPSPAYGFGYTGGLLANPQGVAVDSSGNVWVANYGLNNVVEFIGAGTPVVTPIVASLVSPYTPATGP